MVFFEIFSFVYKHRCTVEFYDPRGEDDMPDHLQQQNQYENDQNHPENCRDSNQLSMLFGTAYNSNIIHLNICSSQSNTSWLTTSDMNSVLQGDLNNFNMPNSNTQSKSYNKDTNNSNDISSSTSRRHYVDISIASLSSC